MSHINHLLHKYQKPTPAERYTKEYKKQIKTEQRIKNRHLLLDELLNEIPFHINPFQEKILRYYINTFPNFKKFHRQASNKTILLAFIFLLRTLDKPKTNVDEYSISRKYKLNNTNFRLIICRLNKELMQQLPLTIHETNYDPQLYKENKEY